MDKGIYHFLLELKVGYDIDDDSTFSMLKRYIQVIITSYK